VSASAATLPLRRSLRVVARLALQDELSKAYSTFETREYIIGMGTSSTAMAQHGTERGALGSRYDLQVCKQFAEGFTRSSDTLFCSATSVAVSGLTAALCALKILLHSCKAWIQKHPL